MERRELLKLVAAGGVSAALGIGTSTLRGAIASEAVSSWGYVGASDPEHWGELSSTYSACRAGLEQSPIDLKHAINADFTTVDIRYQSIPLTILNNGHTIQVNVAEGNQIQLDGEDFKLLQFHFHHPSEHTVEGAPLPMEMHFVHANAKGELAVIGVFLKEGAENTFLRPVWQAMPRQIETAKLIPDVQVEMARLLPSDRTAFHYFGSLTTPPCSEIVKWLVFQEPIEVSPAQIAQFSDLFPLNARPVQPLNRRFVLRSL